MKATAIPLNIFVRPSIVPLSGVWPEVRMARALGFAGDPSFASEGRVFAFEYSAIN